ncbi:type II/IV secretion system protein [Alginatibacterium sediminis]|uniref:Type II/IV secretion system protein n=1 Tax=Alginatibacterium sediminis TaxID=2164068 RepID=A0A420EL94_9ALTE|nr:GspE/PulE family protein [Alginatibacterium sediminis]RKF21376.1 type II/IV secretion system protein [Alginatibacterium sediminis]
MAQPRLRMRLGDLLVSENVITEQQLSSALSSQRNTGSKLGAALIDLKFIGETQLLQFLSQQLGLAFIDLSQVSVDQNAVLKLSEVHARRLRAIVVHDDGDKLTVALSDPADLSAMDTLASLLAPRTIEFAVVRDAQLVDAFDRFYRRTQEIVNFAQELQEEYSSGQDFDLGMATAEDATGDTTVVKLLQSVFEDAVQVGASDIHIEPDQKALRIRQRVDGVLQESILNEVQIASALVLRLKLMAGLDISEKRLPQDGRFSITVRGHNIDIRLSTMPIQNGESVVMRLLDQSAGLLSLEQTGMPDDIRERFRRQIHRPHGMIVVTGPTGSGKTTSLYSALSELNKPQTKIITVEDPVEYRIPRVNQVQVNTKIGLGFSQVLRTSLRQDPDILLVGEMRDQETVEIGLRGALTGHLVLTTLHTNDAITSALRLMDMGAAGYLVASSLRAILAQRLIRRLCETCKHEHPLDVEQKVWLEHLALESLDSSDFYSSKGCQSCNYTGYKGRVGVFELLELNEPMMEALRQDNPDAFAVRARENSGYRPLSLVALDYAKQGITSISEVLRLVEEIDMSSQLDRKGEY